MSHVSKWTDDPHYVSPEEERAMESADVETRLMHALDRIETLQKEKLHLMRVAKRACVIGLATICVYGRRDENGLCGIHRQRYDEIMQLEKDNGLHEVPLSDETITGEKS